jgi:hypothetical protein
MRKMVNPDYESDDDSIVYGEQDDIASCGNGRRGRGDDNSQSQPQPSQYSQPTLPVSAATTTTTATATNTITTMTREERRKRRRVWRELRNEPFLESHHDGLSSSSSASSSASSEDEMGGKIPSTSKGAFASLQALLQEDHSVSSVPEHNRGSSVPPPLPTPSVEENVFRTILRQVNLVASPATSKAGSTRQEDQENTLPEPSPPDFALIPYDNHDVTTTTQHVKRTQLKRIQTKIRDRAKRARSSPPPTPDFPMTALESNQPKRRRPSSSFQVTTTATVQSQPTRSATTTTQLDQDDTNIVGLRYVVSIMSKGLPQ